MPGRLRRGLRRARRGAWYVFAVGLVLMALGAGLTSQLLPLAERHPDRIAEWLGKRAGRPVSFDGLEAAWTRRGPLLRLDGLRLREGPDATPVRSARRGAWYVFAVGLVLMALGAGLTSQLLPLAERHPDRIAEWLGKRAGRPVSFDGLETAWTRRGPLLRLDGLRIGEGPDAIPV